MRKIMSPRWAALAALGLCLSVRAGQEAGNVNAVRFEDLPNAAQKALTLQCDGDPLVEITKGIDAYLIEFTAEGNKQEILVREDLRSEGPRPIHVERAEGTEIQWSDLPQQVQTLISSKFAGASLDKILRRPGIYNAKINRNGETSEIRFTERGRILSETSERELRERRESGEAREREFKAKREAEAHEAELKAKAGQ